MTATIAQPTLLRIGQVSARSQLPVKTIRFYEERGLIQAARRSSGGFRLFHPAVLTRLNFIKRSQTLGLSLNDIQDILAIADSGQRPCQDVRQKFQEKILEIDQRIQQLQKLKQQLHTLINEADQREQFAAEICPIIESAGEESASAII